MRRFTRKYTGSLLLSSATQRLLIVMGVIALMWLLSAWALAWL